MPLKAILDIVLHLESFHNIDLYHFGVYSLKSCIYQVDKNQNVNIFSQYIFKKVFFKKRKSFMQYHTQLQMLIRIEIIHIY